MPRHCVCSNTMTTGAQCSYLEQLLLHRQLLQWRFDHRSPLPLPCTSHKSPLQLLEMTPCTCMLHSSSFSSDAAAHSGDAATQPHSTCLNEPQNVVAVQAVVAVPGGQHVPLHALAAIDGDAILSMLVLAGLHVPQHLLSQLRQEAAMQDVVLQWGQQSCSQVAQACSERSREPGMAQQQQMSLQGVLAWGSEAQEDSLQRPEAAGSLGAFKASCQRKAAYHNNSLTPVSVNDRMRRCPGALPA